MDIIENHGSDIRNYMYYLIKITVMFLLPLEVVLGETYGLEYINTFITIKVNSSTSEVNIFPIGFIVALGLSLPSLYFSYLLPSIPHKKSVILYAVGTVFISFTFSSFPGLYAFLRDFGLHDYSSQTYIAWPIALFVILPIITQEAVPGIESKPPSENKQEIDKLPFHFRSTLIGAILGLFALLSPFLMGMPIYGPDSYSFLSAILRVNIALEEGPYGTLGPAIIVLVPLTLLLTLPLAVFRFLFVFYIIRCCNGRAERTHTFVFGVLGALLPVSVMYLTSGWPFVYDPYILLPVPILFIVGTIILLLVKPLTPADYIWTEES